MKTVKLLLAIGYSVTLAYLVFFARRRRHMEARYLNTVPFRSIVRDFLGLNTNSRQELFNFYSNMVGNVLLFIPLPFIIVFLTKPKGVAYNLSIAASLSLFIEFIQFSFKIGVADIDDVILNITGAMIGIYLVRQTRRYA